MMVVSTDQCCAEIGSFDCHRLRLSKFKWCNNQMFLKIVFIYFLLMCEVLNTKPCLSKLAARLFHWKVFLFCLYSLFVLCCFFMKISNQTLGQEIAKIIYYHFVIVTLIAYQHLTFQRCYF